MGTDRFDVEEAIEDDAIGPASSRRGEDVCVHQPLTSTLGSIVVHRIALPLSVHLETACGVSAPRRRCAGHLVAAHVDA